jgi:hypothetical protein
VAVQPAPALTEVPAPEPSHAPDAYATGAEAISGIVATTEIELAGMLARANRARAGASAEVRRLVRERTAGDRMRLAGLRHELLRHKDSVATGFDSLLVLLDEADRRLACNDESAKEIESELDRPAPSVVVAVQAASAAGDLHGRAPQAEAGAAATPAKRRWWHRWVRPAA